MSKLDFVLLASVVLALQSFAAVGQSETIRTDIPVANGSFQNDTALTTTVGTEKNAPSSWTFAGGAAGYATTSYQYLTGHEGAYYCVVVAKASTTTLSQTLLDSESNPYVYALGDTYELKFDNANYGKFSITKAFLCYDGLASNALGSFSMTATPTTTSSGDASIAWASQTITSEQITSAAAGKSISVVFQFLGDPKSRYQGGGRPMLDNVTVTQVHTVPEPGTVAILVSGLIGLIAYAWRKRK